MNNPESAAMAALSNNPYYSRARRELDIYLRKIRRDNPRYEMPHDEAQRFLQSEEHSMRMQDYRAEVEPLLRARSRLNSCLLPKETYVRNSDGTLMPFETTCSAQLQRQLDTLDLMIKSKAEQFGLAILSVEEKSRLESLQPLLISEQSIG